MTLGCTYEDCDSVALIVRKAGTSFYRGMQILPDDRRLAMYAIYAFCREVDDIADGRGKPEEKCQRLGFWRERIADLYRGKADCPISRVLRAAAEQFALRQEDFVAVIDGMQMDAEGAIVAPDLATLDLYCDRVAAAVGRLSVRAFGDASAAADEVAYALGRALQLTNILRDLEEDAGRRRLYLPREWLEEAGVPADPKAALASPALGVVCGRVAALAHEHFRAARRAMRKCNRRAMKPARLMATTYSSILAQLERRGWTRLDEPVSVPVWTKLALALRTLMP